MNFDALTHWQAVAAVGILAAMLAAFAVAIAAFYLSDDEDADEAGVNRTNDR